MAKGKFSTAVWAFLLAAIISFSAIGCLVTGLNIEADLDFLLFTCVTVSLVWTAACQFRWLPVILLAGLETWVLADLLLGSTISSALRDPLEVLVHHISKYYDRGYHWGVIQWSEVLPQASPDLILAVLAGTVALLVSWVICQRRSAFWAVPMAWVPLLLCMVLSDTVPDTGYLMAFLMGIVLLVMTNSLRRRSAIEGNRVTALLLIPTVLMTCGLFWLVPQEGYEPQKNALIQWMDRFAWGNGSDLVADNPAERVPLGQLGEQTSSYRTVLHVRATISGRLYLRGRSYDSYDGRSWASTDISSGKDTGWSGASITNRGTVRVETVKPLPYFYFPTVVGTDVQQKVFAKGMLKNPGMETEYSFSWGTVKAGGVLREDVRQQYMALPPRTRKLAQEELAKWNLPKDTELLVQAVADKVRNAASYNLSPSVMPDTAEDFAMWFFQEAEEGYCVHFATTAAVLLRAAGVPARYVTGYAVNVRANREESVSARQAHAWVEYFDEEKGWVVLEATPSYGPDTPNPQPTDSTTSPTEETTAPTQPTEETTAPTEDTTQPSVPESRPTTEPTESVLPEHKGESSWRDLVWLLWVCFWAGIIWGQYRVRLLLKHKRLSRGQTNQRALRLWREVSFRCKVLGQMPPDDLLELAEKAKFSQHRLQSEELAAFRAHLNALNGELQKKPWIYRWLLRLVFAI